VQLFYIQHYFIPLNALMMKIEEENAIIRRE